jgi:ligand-binding sensor domain-containing protein
LIRIVKNVIIQIIFVSILTAENPDFQFESITTEDGLSNNNVSCILRDSHGFMWFGTSDGLNRWDGYTFKIFTHRAKDTGSISNNYITAIHEDTCGCLWIGTGDGLNRFDPRSEQFTRYFTDANDSGSISNNYTYVIFEDHNKNLWFGTGCGLNRYNPGKDNFTRYFFPGMLDSVSVWWSNNTISAIHEDQTGKLLLATLNDFLIFNIRTEKTIIIPDIIPKKKRWPNVNTIYKDRFEQFWIAIAGEGIAEYDANTGIARFYKPEPENPAGFTADVNPTSICEDENGRLWIGTANQGLYICDRSAERVIKVQSINNARKTISSDAISCLFQDKQGNMWIGTEDQGIQMDLKWKKPFRTYVHDPRDSNSLAAGEVTGFHEDKDGTVWISHINGNVSLFDRNSDNFKHISHDPQNPASLSEGVLYALCEDQYGNIWIATSPDITCLNRRTGAFKYYRYDLSDPKSHGYTYTLCCHQDRQGSLWFGTSNAGLERFNRSDGTFDRFQHDSSDSNSINDNCIYALFQDSSDNLWIGTDNGLCRLIEDSTGREMFIRYQPDLADPPGESGKVVLAVHEDRIGRLWIITGTGLHLLNREKRMLETILANDALPINSIWGITESHQSSEGGTENLWLRTLRGIVRFTPETAKWRLYDERDGLTFCRAIKTGFAAFYRGKHGEIYSGGIDCMTIFHPDSLRDNPDPPPVVLTGLKINYESVPIGPQSPLHQSLMFTDDIRLAHDQNFLSFEFAALDYTAPAKNRYAYRLEGMNPDWIETDASKRIATYTNLNPGTYHFHVKASNNDGVWSKAISVGLTITPPYWQTAWFRGCLLAMIAVLIYFLYRIRVNRLLELERMRIQIASDLHDDIGSNLTKIAVYSEIIQTTHAKNKIKQSSEKIGNISREIITTLSDIVWSIDARNDTLGDLVNRMRDFLDAAFPPGSIQIGLHTNGLILHHKMDQTQRQNIYLIFKEAVHNTTKHAHASRIDVHLSNESGKFRMEIIDNGVGFDVTRKRPGHHGLANMHSRASRIGGHLTIENEQGTRVILNAQKI